MKNIERGRYLLQEFQKYIIENDFSIVMLIQHGKNQEVFLTGKSTTLAENAYSMLEALCENYTCSVCGKKHNVNVEH